MGQVLVLKLARVLVLPIAPALLPVLLSFLLSFGMLAHAPLVHAQYEKQIWPAGQAVPALSGADLNGRHWDLKALRGKTVVVNFWATWCGPCKDELPSLQNLARAQADKGVVVLTVNVKEPAERVQSFTAETGFSLPVLMDPRGDLTRRFGISIYPSTVLIAPGGQAKWKVLGALDWTGPEPQAWLSGLSRSGTRRN